MMRRLLTLFAVPLLLSASEGCCNGPSPEPLSEKFAVLASTEEATDLNMENNGIFWTDLVRMYCTLLDAGFEEKNIIVLYAKGSDYQPQGGETPIDCEASVGTITDLAIKKNDLTPKDNICHVLCCFYSGFPSEMVSGDDGRKECVCGASEPEGPGFSCGGNGIPELADDDFFLFWMKGHASSDFECHASLGGTLPKLHDGELAALLGDKEKGRRAMIFDTCDSAAWLDDLTHPDRVLIASSGALEDSVPVGQPSSTCRGKSWSRHYDGLAQARFAHWLTSRLDDPAVEQQDESLAALFEAVWEEMMAENAIYESQYQTGALMEDRSQYPARGQDEDDLASCLRLNDPWADCQ